jgi:hypothetical protein
MARLVVIRTRRRTGGLPREAWPGPGQEPSGDELRAAGLAALKVGDIATLERLRPALSRAVRPGMHRAVRDVPCCDIKAGRTHCATDAEAYQRHPDAFE